MEKIKYPWDWRVLLLGAGGFVIAFTIAIISNPSHPQIREFITIFAIFLLFVITNFTFGTYGLLDKKAKTITRTDYLFYTKRIKIADIKFINYRPTWIMGGLARSLYIIDDKENVIEFPNVGWYEPILANIVNDLKKLNPRIELDESAEELVKKYERHS